MARSRHWWKRRINWNGHPRIRNRKLKRVIRYALWKYDVYITSTSDGTHSTYSYHYRDRAVDLGANNHTAKVRCHRGLLKKFGKETFRELFGPDNPSFVKNGTRYTAVDGTPNETLHDNHIHIAV